MSIAKSFADLRVYAAAFEAAGRVCDLSLHFPREERFALTDQVRRSSRAVCAMIAEAWGRRRYRAVFVNKLDEAIGEAHETQAWLQFARHHSYLAETDFKNLHEIYQTLGAQLNRMIDRADDFCKFASDTDYRSIVREESDEFFQSPITSHKSP
jgi:four helix bundle protein